MTNKELTKEYKKTIKLYNECLDVEVWPVYKKVVLDIFGNQEWPNFDETAEEKKIKQKILSCIESAASLPKIDKKIKELIAEAKERLDDGRMVWDSLDRTVFFENY
jgi:hypothetical protein